MDQLKQKLTKKERNRRDYLRRKERANEEKRLKSEYYKNQFKPNMQKQVARFVLESMGKEEKCNDESSEDEDPYNVRDLLRQIRAAKEMAKNQAPVVSKKTSNLSGYGFARRSRLAASMKKHLARNVSPGRAEQ